MNKGKKSIYTAITAIVVTLTNGILSLLVTRLVLKTYGSDFNGLNSTVNQFITMLLLIEGGFTLATNVALFKPLTKQDYNTINKIMAATKNIFMKIGVIFLVVGTIFTIGYAQIIKSELSKELVFLIILMPIISTSFDLFYATKFRILLQTQQREYVLNFIQIGTMLVSKLTIIAIVYLGLHLLLVGFVTMLGAIINSVIIGLVCKKNYNYLDFNAEPDFRAIKGTKDVFVQKLTSMIYNSAPILIISVTVGTLYASLYAVYNSAFVILKSVIYSFINAPSMGFGNLIAEREKSYVLKVFLQYQFIVINVMTWFLVTAAVLIMPFIAVYTKGINDIDYNNWYVATLLVGITFFEIIHIPSGNIINMSGSFKIAKRFQIMASILLILLIFIGNLIFGFYGILVAVMLTGLLLTVLEVSYVHKVYFKSSIIHFLKTLLPIVFIALPLCYIEIVILPRINNYVQFILVGIILMVVNGFVILIFNLIVNRRLTNEVFQRFLKLIPKRVFRRA